MAGSPRDCAARAPTISPGWAYGRIKAGITESEHLPSGEGRQAPVSTVTWVLGQDRNLTQQVGFACPFLLTFRATHLGGGPGPPETLTSRVCSSHGLHTRSHQCSKWGAPQSFCSLRSRPHTISSNCHQPPSHESPSAHGLRAHGNRRLIAVFRLRTSLLRPQDAPLYGAGSPAYPSTDRCSGCFHRVAVMSEPRSSVCCVFVHMLSSLGYVPRSGSAGSNDTRCPLFRGSAARDPQRPRSGRTARSSGPAMAAPPAAAAPQWPHRPQQRPRKTLTAPWLHPEPPSVLI